MCDNFQVENCNLEALERLSLRIVDPQRSIRINADHNRSEASTIATDLFMGLQASIIIARNSRVMITSNLWTQMGITNGTTGTLRFIIYSSNVGPPSLPIAVIMELDEGYVGPSLNGLLRHVVINPIMRGVNTAHGRMERTMLPIRLAFAITIHKCQGINILLFFVLFIYNINIL
jgi:hypothetical protein